MTHCPACQATLPDPPERFCPNCGHDLQAGGAAEIPPPPAWAPPPPPPPPGGAGWSTPPRATGGTPWHRRDQIGLATALVETTQAVLLRPGEFYRQMPVVGGLGGPLLYAIIVGYIGVVANAVYQLVFSSVIGSAVTNMSQDPQMAPLVAFLQASGGIAGFFWALVVGIPVIVIRVFLSAGIFHVVLLVMGGAGRGFEATLRVVAYSEAAYLLNLIPGCGGLLGAVYGLALCAIGLKEAHQTTLLKAIVAVLLPIFLVCCCCAAVIFLFAGTLASMISHAR
jgi:hypothetical protein